MENFFDKWKIKVNTDKTEVTYFTHKRKNKSITKLKLNNKEIETKSSVKYLGVTLDSKLNYNKHINTTVASAKRTMHTLFPLLNHKSNLNLSLKIYMYKSYILPIILYACTVVGNTSKTNINKLQVVQNKTLRLILNKNHSTPIKELHKTTKLKYIDDVIKEHSKKFFNTAINKNELTSKIKLLSNTTAHFKIKHRLINSKIM